MLYDPEVYRGVGAGSGVTCCIPSCCRPVEYQGLCGTCYQAWYRHGMAGLERRADRVSGRAPLVRVPLDLDEALTMLTDAYERRMEVDDTDPQYDMQTKRIIQVCNAIGNVERRKKQRQAARLYVKRFIEARGVETLKEKRRADAKLYRERKKKNGMVRIQYGPRHARKTKWVKAEEAGRAREQIRAKELRLVGGGRLPHQEGRQGGVAGSAGAGRAAAARLD